LNRDKAMEIDALAGELRIAADMMRFLQLKGLAGDAAVIMRVDTGEILRVLDSRPW
jgi:hypothetical protein